MRFFSVHRARKELKETIHYARHVRRMNEDWLDMETVTRCRELEKAARLARRGGDPGRMSQAGQALVETCGKIVRPRRHPKLRENLEVLFVAIAAAMAIRAYFFQPFRIPTGSMQPTLYGITVQETPRIAARNPIARVSGRILFGERMVTVRARSDGYLQTEQGLDGVSRLALQTNEARDTLTVYIGNEPHPIPINLVLENRDRLVGLMGQRIRRGQPLVEGVVKSGDYILVNRMKYHFVRPRRGDVAVFDTRDLTHPQVRRDAYYIKRMVGLPGETISLDADGVLRVNGQRPTDPRFDKIFNHPAYDGFRPVQNGSPRPLLSRPQDRIVLGETEMLFLGDNTNSSLDGRHFGGVDRRRILGPAFAVCWPFDRAGRVETPH